MSNNLALGTLPEGVESPEALINGAFSAIDSLLTESYDIDLSAGNAAPSAIDIRRASFISLVGAGQAREVTLPVAKRTLFLKNFGTAEVTLKCGAKSIAVPAGQARTVRLTGATDGLEDIGGGGGGGGSSLPLGGTTGQFLAKATNANGDVEWIDPPEGGGSFPEAPSDGKTYGRKNDAWAEIPASAGGSAGEAPTFKIWRLYMTIRPGTNQVGVETFNINNAVTSTTPVAASSQESNTYAVAGIRPGNGAAWYSAPDTDNNPWVEYTFPEPIAGDSIYLWINNQTYRPATFRLEGRNSESESWTVAIPDTAYVATANGENSYGIPRVGGGGGGGEGGGIPEAPTDGKQYGRQNEAWTEITHTGEGGGGSGGGGDPFAQYIPIYKIWRFYVSTVRDGPNRVGLSEIICNDTDGASLNSRIVRTAAKDFENTFPIANAFDNDVNTSFMSGTSASALSPQWFEVEFDTPVALAEFRLKLQPSWWERFPSTGWIAGRNAIGDADTVTGTYDVGRASPQQTETSMPFQTVKRLINAIGQMPIDPPNPMLFSIRAGIEFVDIVGNARGTTFVRNSNGDSGAQSAAFAGFAMPAGTKWRFDATIRAPLVAPSGFVTYGLAIREPVSGKLLIWGYGSGGGNPGLQLLRMDNPSTFNSETSKLNTRPPEYFTVRYERDGTSLKLYVSFDYGLTWTYYNQETLPGFFPAEPTQLGFCHLHYNSWPTNYMSVPYMKLSNW